ncbi:MAG: hypothetical protein ACYS21_16470, partial [Planctomycetota bacterium]
KPKNFEDPCNPATSVKLNVEVTGEIEGNNYPTTDVTLPFLEFPEPNGFTFTSTTSSNGLPGGCSDHDLPNKITCWNVDHNIKIWGTDDTELQVLGEEGEYPSTEGDQNYQANLVFTVIDGGGDERYEWPIIEDPCEPDVVTMVGFEKEVDFNVEDNECGAFGVPSMDVGNPNAATDPNYVDDDGNPIPDCYVNIHDALEVAIRWLNCTDPQREGCVQLNL